MDAFLAKLLAYYGMDEEGFAAYSAPPSFSSLPTLGQHPLVQKALGLLETVRQAGGRVLVYGDYDTDGITSASIILYSLRKKGFSAEGYLPSRYSDGYGLTKENVDKIAAAGYALIFTTDNGVTAHAALQEAQAKGLRVIVLDHHEFDEGDVEADAVLHPDRLGIGETPISAGFLAFLFSEALLQGEDDYLLSLAALSTLSDMMPLKSYNRTLVRLGLKAMNENRYPQFFALTPKTELDEKTLGLEVIPKLNAVGRMEKGHAINHLLTYFLSTDKEQILAIAAWLDSVNAKRKEETKAASQKAEINPSEEAIVLQAEIPEGLNGLLASRLLEQYQKPVAVFSPSEKEPGVLVGSLRSKEGFNILKALEANKAPLLSGGGHAFAGGVAIKESDYELFKKDFIYCALKHQLEPKKEKTIPLEVGECTLDNYKTLRLFGPFGMGNPEPRFLLSSLRSEEFTYAKNGLYLSTRLNEEARLFSFSINEDTYPLKGEVSLLVRFALNEYKGRFSLDLLAEKVI
jgi:single-stranded-DNA-specific exonuclease